MVVGLTPLDSTGPGMDRQGALLEIARGRNNLEPKTESIWTFILIGPFFLGGWWSKKEVTQSGSMYNAFICIYRIL